ncbi:MAG: hypothetical protein J1E57_08685 [Prevotella sp.]|nr:hypothetical protein [Prevotella sp.]
MKKQCTVIPLYLMDDFHQVYDRLPIYCKLTLDAGLYRFIPVRQHAFAVCIYIAAQGEKEIRNFTM